ncbi:MAG: acyl carrier protein [Oceanospirillaceae bacterium]|nr:acyl carrier protein [Oceanospirillaceae bacterium]
MERANLYLILKAELLNIAPEASLDDVDGNADLREELDLDSLDFLHLIIAIGKRIGVEIPEADYGRIHSLDALLDYLESSEALARKRS